MKNPGDARVLPEGEDLLAKVTGYLRAHHTMTLATVDPQERAPHAASVFYAVDLSLRLIFLSKPTSTHGVHIGEGAPAAATVTEHYKDWEQIQGVQLWGEARPLKGSVRVRALARYVESFPFVGEMMHHPRYAALFREVVVYAFTPRRIAFTDNTTGVFGREILEL